MINVIKDVDLLNEVEKYDVTLLASNIYCMKGGGLQFQLAYKYLYVYEGNMRTKYADKKKLGTMIECSREGDPTFTLLYITRGYEKIREGHENDFINYEALRSCLEQVNERYKGMKIASTMLGCSSFDGNGNKEKVLAMMNEILTDVDVDVYDYYQKTKREIGTEEQTILHNLRNVDYQKFKEGCNKVIERDQAFFKANREMLKNIIH